MVLVAIPPDNPGADHVALEGAASSFRFRSERVPAKQLSAEVVFHFDFEGAAFGPLPVLDLSATGLGLRPAAMFMPQGAVLERATLTYHGAPVWTGTAAVVYQVQGASPRLGVRFVSSVLDMQRIHVRDSVLHGGLGHELQEIAEARAELPAHYRAAVADLSQLLVRVRNVLAELEEKHTEDPDSLRPKESEVLSAVHETWAPHYYGQLRELSALAAGFTAQQRELSKDYAAQLILPLVQACPMHRRAHEKPFGYAGDYALMRMYFMDHSPADTLYGRFLHFTAQRYTLGRTVVARERIMRAAARRALEKGHSVRILSLACGPAIELCNALEELTRLHDRVELILVDQDEAALAHCHRELSARLAGHPSGRQVDLHCLHFSVRQLLKPRNLAEQRVLEQVLCGVDLVYSAGLFDYLPQPVARHLVHTLYGLLRPGGQLLVGNLREAEDTSWMMENVLSWHLEYREHDEMLDLARGVEPGPRSARVIEDATGYCLFLELSKS